MKPYDLALVLFRVAGLLWLVCGILYCLFGLISIVIGMQVGGGMGDYMADPGFSTLAGGGIYLVFGLVLLVGSRKLARLAAKFSA